MEMEVDNTFKKSKSPVDKAPPVKVGESENEGFARKGSIKATKERKKIRLADSNPYTVIKASAHIKNSKKDNCKTAFNDAYDNVESAMKAKKPKKKVDPLMIKLNLAFEEYKKVMFEGFSDMNDEEQQVAFQESTQITDKMTKLKIKVHRYK